ncbi:MAG: NAD(+)/NADH kinase [Candidatus Sumerlaeota bacterium]|nr:NAD(+)/NADH kinase [Candidatus Sumerlaeota bacterium]
MNMIKRIAVIANSNKSGVVKALECVGEWASAAGAVVDSNLACDSPPPGTEGAIFNAEQTERLRERFAGSDLGVTLGGDGTLLYGAHVFAPIGVPILSVNLGSLGFHTQSQPGEIAACLDAVKRGEYRVERRLLLEARIEPPPGNEPPVMARTLALNEIVVTKCAWGRMLHVRIFINGKTVSDLFADSFLAATPTGSTGYNYAAGGPVIQPDLEAILLNAVCPHRMNFSPLVVDAAAEIRIESHPLKSDEGVCLIVDGQGWRNIQPSESVKISSSPMYLPLIVFEEDYFSKLREKLVWGSLNRGSF